MQFQPLLIKHGESKGLSYLHINCDVFKRQLKIVITDIYTFAKQYTCKSDDELISTTFAINKLTKHDSLVVDDILMNISLLQAKLKPVLNPKVGSLIHMDGLASVTLINDSFQYTFPVEQLDLEEQLEITKSLYSNLESFTRLESELVDSLTTQIKTKNHIIEKLVLAYEKRINPLPTHKESDTPLAQYKSIQQLFCNKQILSFVNTTPEHDFSSTCNSYLTKDSRIDALVNSNMEILWNTVIQKSKEEIHTAPGVSEMDEVVNIHCFGETDPEKQSSPQTRPATVKRKLQGLLRREQKRNKK